MNTLKSKISEKSRMRTKQNDMKKIWFFFALAFTMSHLALSQSINQIPVVAWGGIPSNETTVERYVELREAGFTHVIQPMDADSLAIAMDIAAEVGIKMFVHCPELKTETEKIVKRFMNHPAIAGYYITDEPGRSAFPALGEWVRKIQAIDNQHFCYINLYPNFARYLETETYQEHLHLFIEEVPVPILSFDHYPVFLDQTGNRVLRLEWYENLEIFSDKARKAEKPFWAFALSVEHYHRSYKYPIPTLEELRLQVFSDLVYGAQGIQYFKYWGSLGRNDFYYAPIESRTKKRTEVYDYIKEINTEIKNLSSIFLDAKVVSVGHTGEIIPPGTKRLEFLPDVIKTFETEGAGAVVSVLQKDGKSYLAIVNRDFKNKMKVKIEGEPGLQRVLKDGSTVPASAYINTMTVAPGDILIYCWNR